VVLFPLVFFIRGLAFQCFVGAVNGHANPNNPAVDTGKKLPRFKAEEALALSVSDDSSMFHLANPASALMQRSPSKHLNTA
jgi:hypothetical protein